MNSSEQITLRVFIVCILLVLIGAISGITFCHYPRQPSPQSLLIQRLDKEDQAFRLLWDGSNFETKQLLVRYRESQALNNILVLHNSDKSQQANDNPPFSVKLNVGTDVGTLTDTEKRCREITQEILAKISTDVVKPSEKK